MKGTRSKSTPAAHVTVLILLILYNLTIVFREYRCYYLITTFLGKSKRKNITNFQ